MSWSGAITASDVIELCKALGVESRPCESMRSRLQRCTLRAVELRETLGQRPTDRPPLPADYAAALKSDAIVLTASGLDEHRGHAKGSAPETCAWCRLRLAAQALSELAVTAPNEPTER